ncbi:MAG TPA: ATP-binding protein [Chitinophagaceae bacterium]|nr:ATP-binding protein [Chitinophagaceae bacterium]
MRKYLFFLFLLVALKVSAQVGYEDFYSEKDLQKILQNAKTITEQMDATGSLAVYYKRHFKDSLADLFIKKIPGFIKDSNDHQLVARSLGWDVSFESNKEKAELYLQYAEKYNLLQDKISAYLTLSDVNIHQDLFLAEQNALDAQTVLGDWKKDTLGKDSVRVEIYYRFAHAYIHKKDGIKTSQFLQLMQDYATNGNYESLRMQAVGSLWSLYFEWDGQEKKAFPWLQKEYEYLKRIKEPNKLLLVVSQTAILYSRLGNKEKAKAYFEEAEKLKDSLQANTFFQFYWLWNKYNIGLITLKQFIQTLDNNFNNTLILPRKLVAINKAQVYWDADELDSAGRYILIAQQLGETANTLSAEYFLKRKDYNKALSLSRQVLKDAEKAGDIANARRWSRRLSRIFGAKHEYDSAYEYLNKAWTLRDSLDKLTSNEQVAEMEMQKQMDLQKAGFDEQKKIQDIETDKTAFKNRIRFIGLLTGIGFLLLLAGMLWRNNRRKQRDKIKIEQAYGELKSTQAQLIQSEKMASLGELTAGIAHEIQNPLNFVNNFSEVSNEMIDEMSVELNKGDTNEAKVIAAEIKQNLEKINHHGKRADAIVKNMLQHSRSSSGVKEPTNINALTDEYLRLSYHGLRAKDKSFNATMKTDFDESIGNINIIPQDIGRVVLNLINNAFYAVDEKKKQNSNGYEPTVSVSTTKQNGKVEIRVKDNGNGIPQKVLDKIFQPFFTTKPTGEGTGLGLSLAYDIITKGHGGELKVETKEGEGSEFIIQLPNQSS